MLNDAKKVPVCVCGCNGRPFPYDTDGFDYRAYKTCPARLHRKRLEKESKAIVRYEQKVLRQKVRDESRQKEKEEKKEQSIEQETKRERLGLQALSAPEARRRGLKIFMGKPCKRGHSGERDTRSGECVLCRSFDKKRRDAMRRGAFPEDLSQDEKEAILIVYKKAKDLSKITGVQHHVDHIKPLKSGGKHHPENLQILTAEENLRKGASWNGEIDGEEGAARTMITVGVASQETSVQCSWFKRLLNIFKSRS
jgi:5-methylcytosine-specific restriction endonuclease McrA